jgi:hypothetical protein
MLTQITHVKRSHGDTVVEVGAVNNGIELWRTSIPEAVQRYRTGVRFFIKLPDGTAIAVIVQDGGFYLEPTLRTVADGVFDRKLQQLPEFPH